MEFFKFLEHLYEVLGISDETEFLNGLANAVGRDLSTIYRWRRKGIPNCWLQKNRSKIEKCLNEAIDSYCNRNCHGLESVKTIWNQNRELIMTQFPECSSQKRQSIDCQEQLSSDEILILKKFSNFIKNL